MIIYGFLRSYMIIYGINEDIMAILWECKGDTLRKAVNNGNLAVSWECKMG